MSFEGGHQTLKLACHTWGFSDQPLAEAIQTIARLGFNYIDLGSGPHLDIDSAARSPEAEAKIIREMLDDFNLEVTDLYLLLPALASVDEGRRLYEIKQFERLLPFAVALGTPGITLSPGIGTPEIKNARIPRLEMYTTPIAPEDLAAEAELEPSIFEEDPTAEEPDPEPPPPTPFDYAIDSFQRIIEIIEDTDLRLSFEPHTDSVAPTPEKALELLETVPGLSLTLDWAQFTAQGIVSREIEPLLPHTAHVQVRQAARGRLQTPYHEGIIDLRQVVSLLVQNDYRGAISVEYMNRAGTEHGVVGFDVIREASLTRDTLRKARRQLIR
jgi:sugar phosphate isomerase/epimerase